MIYKYGLINHFEKLNAYLSVIFDDIDESIIPSQDEDVLIYQKDGKIVRIDIFGLKKYVKIKINGLIHLPNFELIAIINGYLGKYDMLLASKTESGYFVGKKDKDYIVKVKKDVLLADGTFTKEERDATYYDLDINDPKMEIILDPNEMNEAKIGSDIYEMEENDNVGNWIKETRENLTLN